jgi:ABC-type antimicrobial peptide transport system permease subunit
VLEAIGIYGVTAFSVGRRTHEIGVRMALGAHQRQIQAMVLRRGAALIAGGIAAGLAGSIALTRLIANQLWGVSATDPATLAGVAVVLAATGLAACAIPARRAARVNPTVALKYE